MNQEIETYLRLFVNQRQDDWSDWLPLAEFTKATTTTTTGTTPFYLTHGRHPWKGIKPIPDIATESVEEFTTRLNEVRKQAHDTLKKSQDAMKRYYDKKRTDSKPYQVGDQVWLDGRHLQTTRPSKKLEALRHGPFSITEKVGNSSYHLKLPPTWKVHPVLTEVLLSPYHITTFLNQRLLLPPPPILVDSASQSEVERVLDARH